MKKYCKFRRKYVEVLEFGGDLSCADDSNMNPGRETCPFKQCYLRGFGSHVFDTFTRSLYDNPFGDNPDYDPLPPL